MIKLPEGKASGRYEDKTSLKNHQVRLNTLMQIVFSILLCKKFQQTDCLFKFFWGSLNFKKLDQFFPRKKLTQTDCLFKFWG
jgi:hypothetical protein